MSLFFPKAVKFDASDYDPSQRGGEGFGVDDYEYLIRQGVSLDQIKQIANNAVGIGPRAQSALSGIPAPPTMDEVFADWNREHYAKYGTYVDFRRAPDFDLQKFAAEREPELVARQQEWFAKYGDTPEAKAFLTEPVPTWGAAYAKWEPEYREKYGNILNRPWYSDQDAINQKQALDRQYLSNITVYNKKYGTNFQPNTSVLGTDAQPNVFVSPEPKKDNMMGDILKIGALAAAGYGLYSLASGAAAAGAAGGAGGAGAAGIVGTPGVSTIYPVATWGGTVTPIAAATAAGATAIPVSGWGGSVSPIAPISAAEAVPAGSLAYPGIEVGPTFTPAPGSFQAALPEFGVQTAASAAPFTAVPGSFQAAVPSLLGEESAGLGLNVTDALKQANNLLGGQPQQQPQQTAMPQPMGGMQRQGVDYSGLLNLLSIQANRPQVSSLLAPAQLMPQYSLLG